MVECTALEMRHARKGIGGSNPSLSAKLFHFFCLNFRRVTCVRLIALIYGIKLAAQSV